MRTQIVLIMTVFTILGIGAARSLAAVTEEEAAELKTSLTPMGAERIGNAEGTIPAWEGGYTTVPDGYVSGQVRPDPFADEKPLYSVTVKNKDQYADQLSEALKEVFIRFPDFRMDVYPTHRTAAAPQWVYDNTFKNATRARTTNGGLKMEGAFGGAPFPIPKDGYEILWNHLTAWKGVSSKYFNRDYIVPTGKSPTFAMESDSIELYSFYRQDISPDQWNGYYHYGLMKQTMPPYKAGEQILVHDPVDLYGAGRSSWQYLTGQRRIRRAPTISFDTPNFLTSGFTNFD